MKKTKGITLISLIITIIVMLILVAVAVKVLIDSDLIGATETAAEKYKTAYEEELSGKITIGGKTYNSLQEYLDEKRGINSEETTGGGITITKSEVTENTDGTVTIKLAYDIEGIPLYNEKYYTYKFLENDYLKNKTMEELLLEFGEFMLIAEEENVTEGRREELTEEERANYSSTTWLYSQYFSDFTNMTYEKLMNNEGTISHNGEEYSPKCYLKVCVLAYRTLLGVASEDTTAFSYGANINYAREVLPELIPETEGKTGDEIKEIANRYLEQMEADFTFEEYMAGFLSNMGISDTETALANANAALGLTYEGDVYAITEDDLITLTAVKLLTEFFPLIITNPDNTTTYVDWGWKEEITSTYTTQNQGSYVFSAVCADRTGTATISIQEGLVINPYEEDEWVVAWTHNDNTWSGLIENTGNTTLTGDTIVKLYDTGEEFTPTSDNETQSSVYSQLSLGKDTAYAMVIEGIGTTETELDTSLTWHCNGYAGILAETYESGPLYCFYITKAYILEGVESVPADCFNSLWNLNEVFMANSLNNIGYSAFSHTALTSAKIPEGVTSLGYQTFSGCDKLTNVVLPDSVTTIGSYVFQNCNKLENINVPTSLSTIEENAFYCCESLTSFNIPSSVTSIGAAAFRNSGLTTITVPNSVTSVGASCFANCDSLASATFNASIQDLPTFSFSGCAALQSVELNDEILTIGNGAFQDCSLLEDIVLPSALQQVGSQAFWNCTSLKTIELPSTVSSLGGNCFMNLASDSIIYVPNATVQALFNDGTNYDSSLTSIVIK